MMLRNSIILLAAIYGLTPTAIAAQDNHNSEKHKTADDIEIIVESDHLCDPEEELRMPRYY